MYMRTHIITVVTGELYTSSPTLKITSLKNHNRDGIPACVISFTFFVWPELYNRKLQIKHITMTTGRYGNVMGVRVDSILGETLQMTPRPSF